MTLTRPLPTTRPSEAVAHQARAWMDRVAAGEMTPADGEALRRWCRADPAHQAALSEARRGWALLGAAGALSAARAPQRAVVRSPSRRWFIGGGLGFATAAAAAAIVHPPLGLWPSIGELQADHRTGIGERRSVALGAGVRVELNTRTSIALRPDGIALIAGEAAIDMQGLDSRIAVEAGPGRVNAAGARFEVRRGPEGICVSCLAGRVEVAHAAGTRGLAAGQQLVYDAQVLGPVRVVDAGALARLSAWREGYLRFVDTPLGEVVAEINRYRAGQVLLLDRQLAGRQVTGRFQIASLDRAIAQIQHSLGLGVRSLPGGLVLLS
jgi:transmembrane sensor